LSRGRGCSLVLATNYMGQKCTQKLAQNACTKMCNSVARLVVYFIYIIASN